MVSPVSIPFCCPSPTNHCAINIASDGRDAPSCCPTSTSRTVGHARHRRPLHLNMSVWPYASRASYQPHKRVSGLLRASIGARVPWTARPPSSSRAAMPERRTRGPSAHQMGPSPSQTAMGVQVKVSPDWTTSDRSATAGEPIAKVIENKSVGVSVFTSFHFIPAPLPLPTSRRVVKIASSCTVILVLKTGY